MNNQIENNKENKYGLVILIGTALLIISSLLGWSSRTVWVLAIMEVAVLCLFLFFIAGIAKKESELPFSLKLFLFFSLLSVIFSVYWHDSVIEFVKIFLFVIAFWIVTQAIRTIKQLNNLTITLSLTALVASIYGLINFFQLQNITLGVASFFGWRNIFGGFILLFLPLILTLYLTTTKKREKYFFGLTTILLTVNLYFTFSQASWLSFLIVFLVIIWFLRKLPKKQLGIRLAVFFFIVILIVISFPKLHTIFVPISTEASLKEASAVQTLGIQNRLDYWKTSLEISKHYPWLGVGLGNFETLYTHFQQNIWSWSVSPHNFVLLLLAEVGLLGTIPFLFFLFILFKNGLAVINKAIKIDDRLVFPIAIGLTGSLTASFLHSLFDLDWEVPALLLVFFIEAGLLFALKKIITESAQDPTSESFDQNKKVSKIQPIFGLIIFGLLGYVIVVSALTDLWYEQAKKLQEDLPFKEEGLIIIKNAVKLDPWNADLYRSLSDSYQLKILDHQGEREENQYLSVKYAQKAAALDSQNSERHQFLGYTLNFVSSGSDQEIESAEKELRTAIEYNPDNNPYYYQLLGYILYRQGKYQEALAILDIPFNLFNEASINKVFADEPRIELIKGYLERIESLKDIVEEETKNEGQ
ncbi:MAG: hypothetical protein COY66_01635 [Candidatus Kerfeldbacteria bacterium CG_4_10_14_0_8_um_filter_42_10]|uniref:O-antigen ligase-related domain-containing protein n=1 Tax=Candidatus Kerfeldbacteria bacterium CG_4_10_14_0_8_um_filter_42_10 TaxID=2014248 RepID=A0A2M7RJU5_9BACT|nr:MAG: hypothetical protein COY66_01635 [Candidatus Kerfeldbacteria bacterium CG_4_10_14_0_8_um_filter_42_10]